MSSLPRSTPESQGLSAAAIDAFVAALDASDQEFHTVTLVRHGHVVLEAEWAPYRLTDRQLLYSVSKSFTATAIGLAVDEGLLSVDDKVVSFFGPDDLPATISDNLAAMSVRHLLTMSTGHAEDTIERITDDGRWVRAFLALDVEHEPGAPFVYNTGATYMLSAILQRASGQTLLDYLRPRLFEPLGSTEATWPSSPEGITMGGWELSLNSESLAKFGQLVLQRGLWEGKQLVPAEWLEAATAKQVSNENQENADSRVGYGYQFWRGRHNTYRADGAFGQFIICIPEHDAVLAVTSAATDMQAEQDLFWEHLLPALEGKEVPAVARPERLELLPPTGPAPRGGDGVTYSFERTMTGLRSIRWDADGSAELTVQDGSYPFRAGGWLETDRVVTTAYGDGDALVATIRWLEGPHATTFTCRIADGRMTVDAETNVTFGEPRFTITGTPS